MTLNIIEAALDARFGDAPAVAPTPSATIVAEPTPATAAPEPKKVTFLDRVAEGLKHYIPVIPTLPRDKKTVVGAKAATLDPTVVGRWNEDGPDSNSGLVAQAKSGGVWILDCDSSEVREQFEKDTGRAFPDTFSVRSSKGGHRYFRQNEESLKRLKNFSVHRGDKGEFFSVRWDNEYCVGPLSVHPSGVIYTTVSDIDPVEAPSFVIDWVLQQDEKYNHTGVKPAQIPQPQEPFAYIETRQEFEGVDANREGPKIPYGAHDNTLTKIAGKLHWLHPDWSEEQLAEELIAVCEARCINYGSDYRKMCEKIAGSIGKRPVKADAFKEEVEHRAQQAKQAQEEAALQEPEIDDSENIAYPVFPREVMEGTSIYEGLAKPVSEASEKYPELLFMPGVAMLLNSIFGQVHIKLQSLRPNIFLGIVGPYGNFYKSTCCELAHDYFVKMDRAIQFNPKVTKVPDGKIAVVSSVGSPEGFGKHMAAVNCRHAVLYYDELSKFVGKANIENSSFVSDMLGFYESRPFGNLIKAQKDCFAFEPGSYCFSWMWCTTDRKFPGLWSKIPGDHADFDNRLFFLLTPEQPKQGNGRYQDVDTTAGASETQRRIEAAITQKVYDYDDCMGTFIDEALNQFHDARDKTMLQVLSLYFAIDLGRSSIDNDCVDRAYKLVRYRQKTCAYLDPIQAETKDGAVMVQIVREVRRNRGTMRLRDLEHNLDAQGKGSLWDSAIRTLVLNRKRIALRDAIRGGKKQRPAMVYLLKQE